MILPFNTTQSDSCVSLKRRLITRHFFFMASSVFYRFRSQKDESRITFDGTGISVFDLKKEVVIANNLCKAKDFKLIILNSSGEGL